MSEQPLLRCEHDNSQEQRISDDPDIHQDAQIDDIPALRKLVEKSGPSELYRALTLHRAAAHNFLPSMDYILSLPGSNIDALDGNGSTPVFHAIIKNAPEAVVWLVRRGADTKIKTKEGITVAHWAARTGSASLLALLANLGVDVEAPDQDGNPALVLAVKMGRFEVVEYLVVTRGSSDEAICKARNALTPGPASYWIARCLEHKVGCHEPAASECWPCGPTGAGCSLVGRLCCAGPEQVQVIGRVGSLFSGVLADVSAVWLYLTPTTTQPDMSLEWRQSFALAAIIATIPCWICFIHASVAKPAVQDIAAKDVESLQDSQRSRYQAALASAAAVTQADYRERPARMLYPAETDWWRESGPIIHQLAVVGPLRSKFCKATRRVVPLFDHYCAFLRAPVGVHNFWSFVGTVALSAITCLCVALASMPLVLLGDHWEMSLFFVLYAGTALMMLSGMLCFHTTLACRGHTQYEQHLVNRGTPPAYMINEKTGEMLHPYRRGCASHCCGLMCQTRSMREGV